MRLIAPTAFKGTMSPLQAAQHLAGPGDRLLPLSDGGDGFVECLQQGLGGDINCVPAADPFGRIRSVPVLLPADGPVALECAKAIGLAGLDCGGAGYCPRVRKVYTLAATCVSGDLILAFGLARRRGVPDVSPPCFSRSGRKTLPARKAH